MIKAFKPFVMFLVVIFSMVFVYNVSIEILDLQTKSALIGEELHKQHNLNKGPKFIEADYRCMAENIYFESRGESLKGQIAVGVVTMNRWKKVPHKSICDIVYESKQFSWVNNKYHIQEINEWNAAVRNAKLVMDENITVDEVKHATHFHATYVKPKWAKKKTKLAMIGKHIFYA